MTARIDTYTTNEQNTEIERFQNKTIQFCIDSEFDGFTFEISKVMKHGAIVRLFDGKFTANVLVSCASGETIFYFFYNFHLFERTEIGDMLAVVRKAYFYNLS